MSDKKMFNKEGAPTENYQQDSSPMPDKLKQLLEVPYQNVPIPSKGLLYNEEHPLHMQESVQIKEMTSVEENILVSPALLRQGTVARELLKSCLVNKSIDPDDLLIGDRNALLLAVRISGFGAKYRVQITCGECIEKFEYDYDLSNVKLSPLGEDAKQVEAGRNLFEFVLPITGIKVKFSLLTEKQDNEIAEWQENRKKTLQKQGKNIQVDHTITDRMLSQIHSMEGETDKQKIATAIKNMRVQDARALREHMANIEPDVDMRESIKCPQCGEMDEYVIPLTREFFWPQLG